MFKAGCPLPFLIFKKKSYLEASNISGLIWFKKTGSKKLVQKNLFFFLSLKSIP
jgi:hypothetical protein